MNHRVSLSLMAMLLTTPAMADDIAIAIHGGAGTILKRNMSAEQESAYRQKLQEALEAGYGVLKQG